MHRFLHMFALIDRFRLQDGLTPIEGFLIRSSNGLHACMYCWTWRQANVVCRSLGYGYALSTAREQATGKVKVHGVCYNCSGEEENLNECTRRKSDRCLTKKSEFVVCSNASECALRF